MASFNFAVIYLNALLLRGAAGVARWWFKRSSAGECRGALRGGQEKLKAGWLHPPARERWAPAIPSIPIPHHWPCAQQALGTGSGCCWLPPARDAGGTGLCLTVRVVTVLGVLGACGTPVRAGASREGGGMPWAAPAPRTCRSLPRAFAGSTGDDWVSQFKWQKQVHRCHC